MRFEWNPPDISLRAAGVFGAFVVLAAFAYWYLSAPVEAPVRAAAITSHSSTTFVIVDVVGAVNQPGVIRLPAGARVYDAVAAAGGVLRGNVPSLNMARPLVDGEQLVVGQTSAGSNSEASGKVSINSATAAQLEALPGIGPVLAGKIVEYRSAHGHFAQLRDLLDVPGIGDAKYSALADAVAL